jgi:5-formyltetrahydrofolate cyclo-ligase
LNKQQQRAAMKKLRAALTPEQVAEKSRMIFGRLREMHCFEHAKNIMTYISAFQEPDTIEIIKFCFQEGKRVTVPVTDQESCTLSLSYLESMQDLKKGAYGILEPAIVRQASPTVPEVILIPGLVFDQAGGRTGFGKGYYDRLLPQTRAVTVGLCYDFQVVPHIDTEPHDIPMDFILTEKRKIDRKEGTPYAF